MTDIKTAIRTILTSDATYLSAVGSPTAAPYNTYYLKPPVPPSFPQVVFWLRPGKSDGSDGKTKNIVYDLYFYVWTQEQAGNYETIRDRIIFLLHQKGGNIGYRIVYAGDKEEVWDDEINANGVQFLFNLFYRRALV